MNQKSILITISILILFAAGSMAFIHHATADDEKIISYTVDLKTSTLQIFWKNDKGQSLQTFENLKKYVASKNEKLVFAMNGGMFKQGFIPLGLLIQSNKEITPLDTSGGKGNFYLKPNGVFYITTDNKAGVCASHSFIKSPEIKFATQSGPMLLIDGVIHPAFTNHSTNLNIRNGVGILPDGRVVFAISKQKINFYDFASYFKSLGCKNALYLDGFVSRIYLPEKSIEQMDGNFGVMIGAVQKN